MSAINVQHPAELSRNPWEGRPCQVSFAILKHLNLKETDLPVSQAAALPGCLCCYLFTGKGEKDPYPNQDSLRPLSRDLRSNWRCVRYAGLNPREIHFKTCRSCGTCSFQALLRTIYFSAVAGKSKPFNTNFRVAVQMLTLLILGPACECFGTVRKAQVPVPAGCPVALVDHVIVLIDKRTLWWGNRDTKLLNTCLNCESRSAFEFVCLHPFSLD